MGDDPRLDKALRHMQEEELDGFIIYSNGTRHILRPAYFHYFSGLQPLGPNNAVIISKDGDITLLVEPPWDAQRVSEKSWIKDVRGCLDFTGGISSVLHEFGINNSIGVAGISEVPEPVYTAITASAAVKAADNIIEEIAREKTPSEIETVRKVAGMADIGFEAVLETARNGIREYELTAEAGFAMRNAGADDIFMLISTECHNHSLHGPLDKRLAPGDILIFEMAPFCDGQCVQVCRTIVLGEANPILQEKYDLLVHAFEESLKQIKPGLPASLMSREMNRIIGAAGYEEFCRPPHMRARGHGFGVGSIAPGAVIGDDTEVLLEKDQVLVPHPNQYFPETGYLACGDSVLVTDTGMERLSKTEARLYVK